MATTAITKTSAPGPYGLAGVLVTQQAADVANGNHFQMSGDDLLIAENTDGANPYTVTITSVQDGQGRLGSITAESLAAGVVRYFGPFRKKAGWAQTTGVLNVSGENAAIKFSVIKLNFV